MMYSRSGLAREWIEGCGSAGRKRVVEDEDERGCLVALLRGRP